MFTDVFGMTRESQFSTTLEEYIRKWGAMSALKSDNGKAESSKMVKLILQKYAIKSYYSEPYMQHQNRAERRIQDVKSFTLTLLDRTGSPSNIWYLAMEYAVYIINRISHKKLHNKTPIEVCFVYTPDISSLLCFQWYQDVFYLDSEASFPSSKELHGNFVGISENVGDSLTFLILTDSCKVISRSVVISAVDVKNPNLRMATTGEECQLMSLTDASHSSTFNLPVFDPQQMIGDIYYRKTDDGTLHRLEVIKRVEDHDEEIEKFLTKYSQVSKNELTNYASLIDDRSQCNEMDNSMDIDESDKLHRVSEIDDHRKMGRSWEVLVSWDDGSQTWQQLSTMAKDSPIKMDNYEKENNLLEEEKCKRFRDLLKDDQNATNIRNKKKIYLNHYNHDPIFNFGIWIPRNYKEATRLDIQNGN